LLTKITLVGIPVLAVATVVTVLARPQQQVPNDLRVITLSSQWVPFTADIVIRTTHGEQRGVFCRRSDGSTATILDTSGPGKLITISNVQTKRTYASFPDKGWVSYEIAPSALQPPRTEMRVSTARSRQLDETVAGGPVYEFWSGRGAVVRYSAALNGTPIYSSEPNGVGRELHNIVLGEPPNELFLPPSGVEVQQTKAASLLPPETAKKFEPNFDPHKK
jgi:hypothetical protein